MSDVILNRQKHSIKQVSFLIDNRKVKCQHWVRCGGRLIFLFPVLQNVNVYTLRTYLFFWIRAGQISPFLYDSSQVDGVKRYQNLSDLIVLRESIKVVDGKHERLRADLGVRHLAKRWRKWAKSLRFRRGYSIQLNRLCFQISIWYRRVFLAMNTIAFFRASTDTAFIDNYFKLYIFFHSQIKIKIN